MRRPIFALMLALPLAVAIGAETTIPDPPAALQNQAQFQRLSPPHSLPKEVFHLCADANGLLAAPGERWNPIDVAVNGMPTRRLIWAYQSEVFIVVHYEQGGFVHSNHVLVARIRPNAGGFDVSWRAEGPRLQDYRDFIRELDANVFQPEPQ